MRPKLQKQSALKLAGRIIPGAKLGGTINNTNDLPAYIAFFVLIVIIIINDERKNSNNTRYFSLEGAKC